MPDKTSSKRNPPWTTDELILALDLYLKNPLFPPNKDSKEIQELSDLLNRLGSKIPGSKNTTYRNTNGVHMKLMSFRHLDPQFESRGKMGLQRGGKHDEIIWNQFASHPDKCRQMAKAIREIIVAKTTNDLFEDYRQEDGEMEAQEGRIFTHMHRRRERNQKLVEQKKKQFLTKHGRLFCEVCGFCFEQHYGKRGEGIIDMTFSVDDLDKEAAQLVEKGVSIVLGGTPQSDRAFAYFDTREDGGDIMIKLIQAG